ncbi:SHOCT domain-containing protein [Streptomyces sp. NPDC017979]|uniref:SHOCT domain-containing protein n=1 Tax=Streptomyces sp. NPDC017979 TaxID=3365024 RepID=UPI0037BA0A96
MMYWDGGGGWAWMAFMPLLWIVLIGLVVWAVVRLANRPDGGAPQQPQQPSQWGGARGPSSGPPSHGPPQRDTPEEILDRRFAMGEMDADAYAEARRRLAEHRARPPEG